MSTEQTSKFVCRRCGHEATTKQNLIKHLNNKNVCDVEDGYENISVEKHIKDLKKKPSENAVVCKFCGSLFNHASYIKSHHEICKHNPQSEKYVGKQPIELQTDKQKNAILKEELKKTKQTIKTMEHEIVSLKNHIKTLELSNTQEITTRENNLNFTETYQPIQLIIQIHKQQITKKKIPNRLRVVVWNKYIGENVAKSLCMCCKDNYISCFKFHCGHVVAECNGGETTLENLRPICDDCNLSMLSMNMKEFAYKYFKIEII